MNKTDRERMEINKKALLAGLKSRKGSLEKILFETMNLLKTNPSQKLVAKKEVLQQSIKETKERMKEVERPDFDGKCEECKKPISVEYLQEHIFTSVCKKCAKKQRAKELRKR